MSRVASIAIFALLAVASNADVSLPPQAQASLPPQAGGNPSLPPQAQGSQPPQAGGNPDPNGNAAPFFTFGAFGDHPYYFSDPQMNARLSDPLGYRSDAYIQRMYDSIAAEAPMLMIHVGDTKSGKTTCKDSADNAMKVLLDYCAVPVVYVPGDNEWTDCHRASGGSIAADPLARLAYVRSTFFGSAGDSLISPLTMRTQASAGQPENRLFAHEYTNFVTIHMPGSNNNIAAPLNADKTAAVNDCAWFKPPTSAGKPTGKPLTSDPNYNCYKNSARTCQACQAATNEFVARNVKNIAWLKAAFADAKANNQKSIVVAFQADMATPSSDNGGNLFGGFVNVVGTDQATDGFADFAEALRSETANFGGFVLAIHGDSHAFIDVTGEFGLSNFRRVMVPGESLDQWVKISVSPDVSSIASHFTIEHITPAGNEIPNPRALGLPSATNPL